MSKSEIQILFDSGIRKDYFVLRASRQKYQLSTPVEIHIGNPNNMGLAWQERAVDQVFAIQKCESLGSPHIPMTRSPNNEQWTRMDFQGIAAE